jgi:hypothetical protein
MNNTNKYVMLSLATASVLSASQTFELKSGWNLIGFTEEGNLTVSKFLSQAPQGAVKKIVTSIDGITKTYDPSRTYLQQFSEFKGGKGYWVNVDQDFNVTMSGLTESQFPNLNAGWNLISTSISSSVVTQIEKLKTDGLKVEKFVTKINGITKTYDPSRTYLQQFSSFNSNSGYWVKVQKLAGTVQTKDGLDVELYVDREGQDISALKKSITENNATELATSLDYSKVSSVIISKTVNGQKHSSSQVDPRSNFADTLDSILRNTLDDKKIKENRATSGASLYVYSVSEGGSPSNIADADVYKVETNGSIGDLIGSTSSRGFIYLASLPKSGKVYISKNKYDSTVQTISSNGNANYIFLSEDDGTGEIALGGDFSTDDKTSGRVLSRLSEATVEKTYTSSAGGIYFPLGGVAVDGSFVKIKSADWSVLPDYSSIKTKLDEVSYIISPLGKISVSAKTAKSEYNFGQSWSDVISYTGNYARNVNQILGLLGVTLTADMLAEVTDDDTNKTTKELLDKLKGVDKNDSNISDGIELFVYNNNAWSRVPRADFELMTKDATGISLSNGEQTVFKEGRNKFNALIKTSNGVLTGPKPMFAYYKQAKNETPDLKSNEYTLKVKVLEAGTNTNLIKSAVKLVRGNGGVELIKNVDANGTATFTLLSAQGVVEDFTISVLEGNHYPVAKTLNLSSLQTPDSAGKSTTDITLEMLAPPKYATIKCEVKDENSYTVANANVELVSPIALATVNQDVKRLVNDVEKVGIEVGGIVGAKYSWFIKKHKDDLNSSTITKQPSRVLNRVSEERWILVKEGSLATNGNFLAYEQIIALAMKSRLASDPDDVKIAASGQFDIAVQVEHDINGDQQTDFTEVATDLASEKNLGKNYAINEDRKYPSIGYISTKIDIAGMYKEVVGELNTQEHSFAIKTNGFNDDSWAKIKEDNSGFNTLKDLFKELDKLGITASNDENSLEWNSSNGNDRILESMRVIGNKDVGYLRAKYDTVFTPTDYTLNYVDWGFVVVAAIELESESPVNVAIAKDGNEGYKWVLANGDGINPTTDIANDNIESLISVQKSTNTKLNINKIAQVVSSNKFLEKLAMPLSEILTEVNATGKAKYENEILFDDGFSLDIIPTLDLTVNDGGQKFQLRDRAYIDLKGSSESTGKNLKDYVIIDRVVTSKPVYTPAIQYDVTDRVGLCEFSPVEMDFGIYKNDNTISLLRIQASKLGYFNSPSVNVPSYKIDEVNTSEREDIKRFDLKIETKPVYNLTVTVEDAGNKSAVISNAIISVDGIKTAQNLAESESVSKIQGSSATFKNVIGGAGSNRIIRVEVPGSKYIPVIKTINNFSSDRTITISLKDSDDQPTRLATTSVLDYAVDMAKGKAKVSIETFDKLTNNDQTTDLKSLTSSAEIVAYVNGKQVKFAKTALTDTKYDIFLPLEIGLNEVYFEVANKFGISRSSSAIIKYNPNIGNIAGTIRNFNLSAYPDSIVLIDIYTLDDLYINTATATINKEDDKAEYVLENLKAKENYKLVAMFLDKDGKLRGYSEQIPVTVPSAQTAKIDLSVEMLVGESAVSGAPLFDTVGDLNSTVKNSDGKIYINATVSNFDFDGNGSLYYVVNDVIHNFNISNEANYFTKVTDTEHTYALENYPVQLDKGVNNFYLIAINPNYAYDWSKDTQIKWIPTDETLKTLIVELNGCDEDKNQTRETCSVIDNAYVSLYTKTYQLISTKMTNEEGKAEFKDLVANTYIVYPDLELGEQYNLKGKELDLNDSGSIDLNLSVFDFSAISVPDFEIYDINETLVPTTGHYTLTPDLLDYNYTNATYEWFDSYYDENNTYMPNVLFSTTPSTDWIPTATGNHEITFNIDVNGSKNSYTKEIYVDEINNTSNRILPQAPEVPNL